MSEATPIAPATTFSAMFAQSAQRQVDRPCLGERRAGVIEWVSYGEVARQVNALVAGLVARGLGAGDTIAVRGDQSVGSAVAILALGTLGATCVTYAANTLPPAGVRVLDRDDNDTGSGYRTLLALGRAAQPLRELAQSGHAQVEDCARAAETLALLAAVPIGPDDRMLSIVPAHSPAGLSLGLAAPLAAGAALWRCSNVAGLLRDAPKVHPTVLLATPEQLHTLHLCLRDHISARGHVPEALLALKLTLARRRRALAAQRRRDLVLNIGHLLVTRPVARHVRSLLGHQLSLVVAVGPSDGSRKRYGGLASDGSRRRDGLAAEVRELFELLGIAVSTVDAGSGE